MDISQIRYSCTFRRHCMKHTHSHVSPIYFSVLLETNLGKFVMGGFVFVCFCPCGATTVCTLNSYVRLFTQRDFTNYREHWISKTKTKQKAKKKQKKQTHCTVSASWISELNVNSSHFGKTVEWALLSAWFGTMLACEMLHSFYGVMLVGMKNIFACLHKWQTLYRICIQQKQSSKKCVQPNMLLHTQTEMFLSTILHLPNWTSASHAYCRILCKPDR